MMNKIKQISNNAVYKRNLIFNGIKLSKKFDRMNVVKKILNVYNEYSLKI